MSAGEPLATPISHQHDLRTFFIDPLDGQDCRSLKLFYFEAGGGHRSAAVALRDVMKEYFPGWQVDLVDLFSDVLRPLDPLHRLAGRYRVEDIYNGILKRGWTYGFTTMLRIQKKLINYYAPELEELLQRYWRRNGRPDLVVSVIPFFNEVMSRTLRRVHKHTPYITVMTDLADCPPHFWQGNQDHHIICGSDMAAYQARMAGYRPEHIFKTSGMILKPHFYRTDAFTDRGREREKLSLDPGRLTALIMFGGNGAEAAMTIVDRLNRSKLDIQSIVMCGRNEKLRKELATRKACHAVGFTAEKVPYFMRLADFFIGKPGPGSISEALHMGLPVIVEHNHRTMPQERYNAQWVREQELGITIKSFAHIVPAVKSMLENGKLERFCHNARRFENRAVYEIPDIFNQVMTMSIFKNIEANR